MSSTKRELSCVNQGGPRAYGRSRVVAGDPLPSSSISFGMTLVMAIACGVAAANIYYNQVMLGIMEAAFPGQATVIGLVPTATQLGFATGLLLLVPLGATSCRARPNVALRRTAATLPTGLSGCEASRQARGRFQPFSLN